MKQYINLLEGNIKQLTLSQTISVSQGFLSLFIMSIIDIYFIAQLGATSLAAISFISTITFLAMSVLIGLTTGITVQISKTLGSNNFYQAQVLAVNSLVFAIFVTFFLSLLGYMSASYFNIFFNTSSEVYLLIKNYLKVWFMSLGFLVLANTSSAIIKGSGNVKIPSRILLISSLINACLDPCLIFGLGPFPELGLMGAVAATIIAWSISCIISLYYLFNYSPLQLTKFFYDQTNNNNKFLLSIRENLIPNIQLISRVSLPAVITNIIGPLSSLLIIKIVAQEGIIAVAAFGIAYRIEALATLFTLSLSIAIIPFVSMNYGSNNYDRIYQVFIYCCKLLLKINLLIYVILFVCSEQLALLFTNNKEITKIIMLYLRLIPSIYFFTGLTMVTISILNAVESAKFASAINVIRFGLFTIPLVAIGQFYYHIEGIMFGIILANIFTGILALTLFNKLFKAKPMTLTQLH